MHSQHTSGAPQARLHHVPASLKNKSVAARFQKLFGATAMATDTLRDASWNKLKNAKRQVRRARARAQCTRTGAT